MQALIFSSRFFMIKLGMKKVKTFLGQIKNSLLPHHTFYQQILRHPLKNALIYFCAFVIVLNSILFLAVLKKGSPSTIHKILGVIVSGLSSYPPELTISIEKGNLISNADKPYLLWLNNDGKPSLVAVVDESAQTESIFTYRSILLLTRKHLIIWPMHNTKEHFVIPFVPYGTHRIDEAFVREFISNLMFIDRALTIFYLMGLMILFGLLILISLIVNSVYIVGASFLALLFFRFVYKKNTVHLIPTMKIGLHAITLPLIVDYSLTMAGIRPPFMHILFFGLFTVFVIGGIYESYWVKGKD